MNAYCAGIGIAEFLIGAFLGVLSSFWKLQPDGNASFFFGGDAAFYVIILEAASNATRPPHLPRPLF